MAASNWPARRPLTTDTARPGPRIVALGGGTGLPVLLGGLKEALFPHDRLAPARRDRLTAIVTVADDGGSSGRLRETYRLQPAGARVLPEAAAAIEAADVIVIAPGSLYTSLIPILLVEGLVEAMTRARGRVVLVMNLMTEPGETEAFTAVDHLLAIRRHA